MPSPKAPARPLPAAPPLALLALLAPLALPGCCRSEPAPAPAQSISAEASSAPVPSAPSAAARPRPAPSASAPSASASAASASAASGAPSPCALGGSWMPDNKRALAVGKPSLFVLDPAAGRKVELRPSGGAVRAFAAALRADRVAVDSGPVIEVFQASDGALLRSIPAGSTADAALVALSPDGSQVASLSGKLRVWEVASGKALGAADAGDDLSQPQQLAFVDGAQAIAGANSYQFVVWNLSTMKREGDPHDTGTGATFPTVLSPDGRWVAASAEAGHAARLWRTHPHALAANALAEVDSCEAHINVAFAPDGRRLHVNAAARWHRVFEVESRKAPYFYAPPSSFEGFLLAASAAPVTALLDDKQVRVVDTRTGAVQATLGPTLDQQGGGGASLSPDGRWLLEDDGNCRFRVRSTRDGSIALEGG